MIDMNQKCYGENFKLKFDNFPYPTKANTWKSLNDWQESYEEFLQECEKFGSYPASHFVYLGEPDGDEEQCGYPDYPDFVISPSKIDPLESIIERI